jgi:eukaryotic-like serine/threonine-protein kinase
VQPMRSWEAENMDEQTIFDAAAEMEDPLERSAYLDMACGDDRDLRERIERRLRAREESDGFLAESALNRTSLMPHTPVTPGTEIGPYTILEQIGQGGFGVVYVAQQRRPIQRKVALKVIKPGMDTREIITRFESERQALALMDHPHVAKVLDAGTSPSGVPYFAMELVCGIPVTDFCNRKKLTIAERLQLFADICRAVQHAHQKGIIHRDLKPSNILVVLDNGHPAPKVIDFGIAKALHQRLTENTVHTALGQIVGTPLYMSPEQAEMSGLDVDTRSDIYSLGVLLYELLTGILPFDRDTLKRDGLERFRRMIAEAEPLKPSDRLSTLKEEQRFRISNQRQVDIRRLRQTLRRDLDWIVMKALEKDPNRRYDSASDFAADVEAYLAGDAVNARPPSTIYLLRKLANRHRSVLASVALIFAALFMGLAVALYQRHEAITARQLAEQRLEEVQRERSRAEMFAYSADVRVASRALGDGDVLQVVQVLNRHLPREGSSDPRGLEWYYLMERASGASVAVSVSSSALYAVCLSPDRNHLVTAGAEGVIYVLDARTLEPAHSFDSLQTEVNGLSFSADGRTLISGGEDGTFRMWHFPTGQLLATISTDFSKAYVALLSRDEQFLIACGDDTYVRIYSRETGELLDRLEGHTRDVESIALSPDGRLLACASSDGHVSVWDWENRRRLPFPELEERFGRCSSVVFSEDGSWMADGSIDGELRITSLASGEVLGEIQLGTGIHGLAPSPDGTSIAVATRLGSIFRLDLADIKKLSEQGQVTAAAARQTHEGRAYGVLWFNGGMIFSVGRDGRLARTSLSSDQDRDVVIADFPAEFIGISPDGSLLAATHESGFHLYDLHSHRQLPLPKFPTDGSYRATAFSPDGARLLAGTVDGRLVVAPIDRLDEVTIHRLPGEIGITSLRFSQDGRRLAVISRDYFDDQVFVLDFPSLQEVLHVPTDNLSNAALSPDGMYLALNHGRDVLVYELSTGRLLIQSVQHHHESVTDLLFLPIGNQIITVGDDWAVRIWDWHAGTESQLVGVHSRGAPRSVAVTRDARTLFTCSQQGELIVWHLPSRQQLFRLAESSEGYQMLALAADDSVLALAERSEVVHWIPLPSR